VNIGYNNRTVDQRLIGQRHFITIPLVEDIAMRFNDSRLTAARLKELLNYDPETGVFTWASSPHRNDLVGKQAGGVTDRGYIKIRLDGIKHRAHRLAWMYVHGHWPKDRIDHINGDTTDNRIANLREAMQHENGQNRRVSKSSAAGLLGVCKQQNNKWVAVICLHRKRHYLGTFATPEEAHQAYLQAKAVMHEFNPVPRQA
jgi:hypothetical protein